MIRVAKYSAGGDVSHLTPGIESTLLVFNKETVRHRRVRWEHLKEHMALNPKDADRIVSEDAQGVVIWFPRPAGFGTPFGKAEEDEDGGDPQVTARREVAEETGTGQGEIYERMIPRIQYTDQENQWSDYYNIVYLVNGLNFPLNCAAITDEGIDPTLCGFYPLANLPRAGAERNGVYTAAIRRIAATFLQIRYNQPIITRLGGTIETNIEEMVFSMLANMKYHSLFSRRMIKTLYQFNSIKIALDCLERNEVMIGNPRLARQIWRNLIMWTESAELERALKLAPQRCERNLFREERMTAFLQECLARKDIPSLLLGDQEGLLKHEEEHSEHEFA